MTLLIRNGTVAMADGLRRADVLGEGERIARVGRRLATPRGATVLDAAGRYVFPGFIDPHVHILLEVMGLAAKDDYVSASRAALVGGTTTLIEMACPTRRDEVLPAFERWRGHAEGRSACDYAFHMGIGRFDARVEKDLRAVVKAGVTSFKVFLAYGDTCGLQDGELYGVLRLARELGVVVCAHCENADVISARQRELVTQGHTSSRWHHESRPPRVEAEGVNRLAAVAELTGARVYIVHTSCAEALEEAERARARGVDLEVEVLIQHLLLDRSHADRRGLAGAKYVMAPPLRAPEHQQALWRALRDGRAGTVASDHAPFDARGQKDRGLRDFTKIPNGLPGIEHRAQLLWTHGVVPGRITIRRFVDALSTRAAKQFGLHPRKGVIAPGADADLVVWDAEYCGTIAAAHQQMNVDYNPYEGWAVSGRPAFVTVRGELAARDGLFTGTPGRGRFLPRTPG